MQRELSRLREVIEVEATARRAELKDSEARVRERESHLERRSKTLDGRERSLQSKESDLDKKLLDAHKLVEAQTAELHRIAELSQSEARDIILARVENESRASMANVVARIEEK